MQNPTKNDRKPDERAGGDVADGSALDVLRQYNRWRRGEDETEMPDPAKIGRAIDVAIEVLALDWTVDAADYDRLASAARSLRRACKHKLPPGHYAQLDEECREIDGLLSPNT